MMMRRLLLFCALVACGTLVAIPVATAAQAKTIRLIEVERTLAPMGGLDARFNSPPRAGQGLAITSDLYFWKGSSRGAHAGILRVVCTFTEVDLEAQKAFVVCNGGMHLAGGTIAIGGSFPQADVFEVPVVGGTGAYVGARGHVKVRSIGGDESSVSADTVFLLS